MSLINPINTITVFNGYSLVAKGVIPRLGSHGSKIVIGYRGSGYNEFRMKVSGGLGQIFFARYELKDEKSLAEAMKYSNVVVNCIGKEHETSNYSFEQVHIEGPRLMARIAREVGVKKFIHFSALNCSPDPEPKALKKGSQFYKSKYYGELAVREEFPDAIIFRPSDILGEHDNFLNHFTTFQRCMFRRDIPLYDYYVGVEKEPVYLNDVVSGVERAVFDDSAVGKTFQAVGPHRYNFYDLIMYMRTMSGHGIPENSFARNLRFDPIMRFSIAFVEKFQKYPFITWERIERDLTSDYVDPKLPTLKDLGVKLTPLEHQIKLLGFYRPRLHRVDVPYEADPYIEPPKRLDLEYV